jgi:diketogulonate reductase-like aldo/keto reductase
MKLDYFDLYLVHWPVSIHCPEWKEINYNTWLGMEELYNNGIVKSIGVSNFLPHHIDALISAGIKVMPMVNQIEYHIGYTQKECVEYCKDKGIALEAWSPLGSGALLNHEKIKRISKKYNVSSALLCLRYVIQNDIIPVVRSSNEQRILENLQVFSFEIDKEDMLELDKITDVGFSGFHPDFNQPE